MGTVATVVLATPPPTQSAKSLASSLGQTSFETHLGTAAELLGYASYTDPGSPGTKYRRSHNAHQKITVTWADTNTPPKEEVTINLTFDSNFCKKHLITISKKTDKKTADAAIAALQASDASLSPLSAKAMYQHDKLLLPKMQHILEARHREIGDGVCYRCKHPLSVHKIRNKNPKNVVSCSSCVPPSPPPPPPPTCVGGAFYSRYDGLRTSRGKNVLIESPLAGARTDINSYIVLNLIPSDALAKVLWDAMRVFEDPLPHGGTVTFGQTAFKDAFKDQVKEYKLYLQTHYAQYEKYLSAVKQYDNIMQAEYVTRYDLATKYADEAGAIVADFLRKGKTDAAGNPLPVPTSIQFETSITKVHADVKALFPAYTLNENSRKGMLNCIDYINKIGQPSLTATYGTPHKPDSLPAALGFYHNPAATQPINRVPPLVLGTPPQASDYTEQATYTNGSPIINGSRKAIPATPPHASTKVALRLKFPNKDTVYTLALADPPPQPPTRADYKFKASNSACIVVGEITRCDPAVPLPPVPGQVTHYHIDLVINHFETAAE